MKPIQVSTVIDALAAHKRDPQRNGAGWKALCPAHDDHRPSLSINQGDDGRALLYCHVGCTYSEIMTALELIAPRRKRGEFDSPELAIKWLIGDMIKKGKQCSLSALGPWVYHDAGGQEVMRAYRIDLPDGKKEFRPVRRQGAGWGLKAPTSKRPLYHLPELATVDVVFVCEGEKCCDLVRGLGITCTTSLSGSQSPHKSDWQPLSGKTVIILPDNDKPGEKYAEKVAGIVAALDPKPVVKIVTLPLANKGDDVEQWLEDCPDSWGPDECKGELLRLAALAQEWAPSQATAPTAGAAPDDETHAETLLRLASVATLFHDPTRRAFAAVPINGHVEVHAIKSTEFRLWLKRLFFAEQGRPPASQSYQDALGIIEAQAVFEGEMESVHIRIAGDSDRTYVDLGDANWRVIEITDCGWQILDQSPVRFRRPRGMLALPSPAAGGSLNDLKSFANCAEADLVLIMTWLAACLYPLGPYPVLVLTGEQGSAKSTLARILKRLIDPSTSMVRSLPRDERDLAIAAANSWLLALDNISRISPWMSDALCRLSTGGGFGTRELWTDDEERIFDSQRPAILNGICEFLERADLMDRCIFVHLSPIPDNGRRIERELWKQFETAAPQLIRALLDAVVSGLKLLPQIKSTSLPRMADFARFGEAVSQALGKDPDTFLDAYRGNRKSASESALEDSIIAVPVRELASQTETKGLKIIPKGWEGTATELLDALNDIASEKARKSKRWPKSPRGMSGAIRRLAPQLRMSGVDIQFDRAPGGTRERTIKIVLESTAQQPSRSSPPSQEPEI
jgi:hypothetical protein